MSWIHIFKLAISIFVAQSVIGFLEGYFGFGDTSVSWILGSNFVSLAICGAIFAFFASRQPIQPFKHAWISLLIDQTAGFAFSLLIGSWLGTKPSLVLSTIGLLVLVCALLVGTLIGIGIRRSILTQPDA